MLNFPNKSTVATDIEDWVSVHEAVARTLQEVRDGTENDNEKDGNFSLFIYITLMAWYFWVIRNYTTKNKNKTKAVCIDRQLHTLVLKALVPYGWRLMPYTSCMILGNLFNSLSISFLIYIMVIRTIRSQRCCNDEIRSCQCLLTMSLLLSH